MWAPAHAVTTCQFARWSGHMAENRRHIGSRKGAQRLRSHVSERPDAESDSGHGLVVRRLENRNEVIGTERPESLLQGYAGFLGQRLHRIRALESVLDFADSLIGVIPEHNIGWLHRSSLVRRRRR